MRAKSVENVYGPGALAYEFGGTFREQARGSKGKGMVVASAVFLPEVRAERRRVETGKHRWQNWGAEATYDEAPDQLLRLEEFQESNDEKMEDSIAKLILADLRYAGRVYIEARNEQDGAILAALTGAVELVAREDWRNNTYNRSRQLEKFFRGFAKVGCPYARRIMAAVTNH